MHIYDTVSGEDIVVAPHGSGTVALSVHCPDFGRIAHVRLTWDQVAALAGGLAGVMLDRGPGARAGDDV